MAALGGSLLLAVLICTALIRWPITAQTGSPTAAQVVPRAANGAPRLLGASVQITPPAYTGLPVREVPELSFKAPTGSVLWTTRVGSAADEVVSSMTISETGILAIAGSTTGTLGQNTSAGGRDGFVIAYQLPSAGGGAQSWV